jgi:hypothetical protein
VASNLSRPRATRMACIRQPSASLRPSSPEKASRRIASSRSDVTPIEERNTQSPCSSTTVRSSQIANPRQAARSFDGRSRDRKRSGSDAAAAFPRAAPPDASAVSHARKREQTRRCTSETVMTTNVVGATNPDTKGRRESHPKTGARRLAAGIEDTFPRFVAFRRNQVNRSLTRWIASPAPSAPRVSHPLSGLIPAHPRGCVSSHIHP